MTITPHLFAAYLKCPTKCWLRQTGESASGNVYAEWRQAGAAVPELRGQKVGSSEIAALGKASGAPDKGSLQCRIAIDHAQRFPFAAFHGSYLGSIVSPLSRKST